VSFDYISTRAIGELHMSSPESSKESQGPSFKSSSKSGRLSLESSKVIARLVNHSRPDLCNRRHGGKRSRFLSNCMRAIDL